MDVRSLVVFAVDLFAAAIDAALYLFEDDEDPA